MQVQIGIYCIKSIVCGKTIGWNNIRSFSEMIKKYKSTEPKSYLSFSKIMNLLLLFHLFIWLKVFSFLNLPWRSVFLFYFFLFLTCFFYVEHVVYLYQYTKIVVFLDVLHHVSHERIVWGLIVLSNLLYGFEYNWSEICVNIWFIILDLTSHHTSRGSNTDLTGT